MLEKSCTEFLNLLASKEPVPGGGGASALVGTIGVALGSMVGNLTVGKKKYADVEEEMKVLLIKSENLSNRLSRLVMKDAEVFEPLSKAYRMPNGTDGEKKQKEKIMQEALLQATLVPLEIAECSVEGLRILEEYANKGSRLVVSDAGVGAVFCKAALQGAKLNVLINLKLMNDQQLRASLDDKMYKLENEGVLIADRIYKYVEDQLCCC
jgi:Methenyl tetrahydrofolate cyclohydrolase